MTIYNRFDPAKRYNRVLYNADRVLQSAELNDAQDALIHRLKSVADVLFKDGGIVRDAGIVVNPHTGTTLCEAGTLYIDGAVRPVPAGQLQISTVGIVNVGVYLQVVLVTEEQDPTLHNPAVGTRGYGEPGAWREQINLAWGFKDDGQAGTFYPIWVVEDGAVRAREAPPNLDAITQALQRYDLDSAGGSYVVRGLEVVMGADLPTGQQVYTLAEGAARISGRGLELPASRRVVYDASPELLAIDDEPHASTTEGLQQIAFDRTPAVGVPTVRITVRSTQEVVHGGFSGAADPLPDTSVLLVESVRQGATDYARDVSWKLTAGQIDWSPAGAEPNPGSTYQVTYQHIITAEVRNLDSTGFDVAGALPGSLILVSYRQALRRYDRLCMDAEGNITWIRGVPSEWNPVAPTVPQNTLSLATVYQSWDQRRRLDQDAVRMVPMQDIAGYRQLLRRLFEDQAELRLALDISGRHSGIKKGLFADPFLNDSMRDAGLPQTAAIAGGALRLPVIVTVHQLGLDITTRQAIAHGHRAVLAQPMRTGQMLVNPYAAFDPLPTDLVLQPAVDRWTDVQTQWAKPLDRHFYPNGFGTTLSSVRNDIETLQETSSQLEFLRPIEVLFESHFGPGETVASMSFDGIALQPTAHDGGPLAADAQGLLRGKFTVPANVPAGTKSVTIAGSGGNHASALFTGQGTLVQRELQQVTQYWYVRTDPLAQTVTPSETVHLTGVDLQFMARGSSAVLVQLREAEAGYPTVRVLVEQRLQPADISLEAPTRVTWSPVLAEAGREYCLVLLCDDASTAVAVAELGKWDTHAGRIVTSQPYQVGVLLSSSNASTWTAHQDRDLCFTLLAAEYEQTERLIDLGSVPVLDATDLRVQAFVHQPSAASSGVFRLTLDNGTTFEAAPGQVVNLPKRYSGPVQVQARLRGAGQLGAILEPGIQLVVGSLQTAGSYISPLINAGGKVSVRVVLEADLPAGSSLTLHAQNQTVRAWVPVPFVSSSSQTAGVMELVYQLDNFEAERVRLDLSLTGNHAARPAITNLRAVVL